MIPPSACQPWQAEPRQLNPAQEQPLLHHVQGHDLVQADKPEPLGIGDNTGAAMFDLCSCPWLLAYSFSKRPVTL